MENRKGTSANKRVYNIHFIVFFVVFFPSRLLQKEFVYQSSKRDGVNTPHVSCNWVC